MAMRPALLLPEIVLFLGALAALLGGSFLPRTRQWVTRVVASAALVLAAAMAAVALAGPTAVAMEGSFTVDPSTGVARLVATLGALVVLALAADEIDGSPRESETYALLLLSTTGTLVLAGADDLLVVAVGFLLTSVPLYGLIGITGTAVAAEAAMKTYLLGALFGILLLSGVTLLYGVSGTTSYAGLADPLAAAPRAVVAAGVVGVLGGLLFKAGGVPAHFWVPDAAQGAGGAVAAFLTTVPKIGAVVAAYRLVGALPDTLAWPLLVGVLAVASMTVGNLAAYAQTDPRRLLGWSTVSQVGYLLVPVTVAGRSDLALPSLLLYLAGYTVTNLAAFAVTTAFPRRRELSAYRGVGRRYPWLAAALVVALLGLVGTPPTAVFVGKLTTTAAAWDAGYAWLAVLVLLNTLVSLFYYLRWIAALYARPTTEHPEDGDPPAPWSRWTAVVTAGLSALVGVGSGVLWAVATA
ncbi:proton-conducting transporter membrane subunit [uncultured Serinicoccus sp.]|uniref:NADH-quinone oxidoreductase subunit N n=1 Tax=uncultured Serinicoccus sp. TaxID=735514 RepID=UPI00262F2CA6|nr:proton-conducting transporter membrane subunit [uncultured Serinicoccus sp.]